jgi:GNAT superfamily N-acetyltransferase
LGLLFVVVLCKINIRQEALNCAPGARYDKTPTPRIHGVACHDKRRMLQSLNLVPTILVRPATVDCVPTILGFIRELAEYEKLLDQCVATEAALREHLFGPKPVAEARIGMLDGKPVGFALFFHSFSTFLARPGLYLEDLYVQPHARGKGVGKALLCELARLAAERGCGRLEWSVLDWNEPSINFYKRMGAVPMSEWTVYRLAGEALSRLANG